MISITSKPMFITMLGNDKGYKNMGHWEEGGGRYYSSCNLNKEVRVNPH